jgi:hypothetical protein
VEHGLVELGDAQGSPVVRRRPEADDSGNEFRRAAWNASSSRQSTSIRWFVLISAVGGRALINKSTRLQRPTSQRRGGADSRMKAGSSFGACIMDRLSWGSVHSSIRPARRGAPGVKTALSPRREYDRTTQNGSVGRGRGRGCAGSPDEGDRSTMPACTFRQETVNSGIFQPSPSG